LKIQLHWGVLYDFIGQLLVTNVLGHTVDVWGSCSDEGLFKLLLPTVQVVVTR